MTQKKTEEQEAQAENQAAATQNEKNLEAQIRAQERSFKQQLAEMPKVTIEIPVDENNPDDVAIVGWNGIIYAIPRGIEFEVPVVIRDIWKESHSKTMAVNKRIKDSVTKEIKVL
ncbi:hypothetical protein ACTHPH_24020 [Paenibacillus pasadenensis]|uniref:hypothetical protein n=1 Tax=Paenibacillus pasadenensis TaxID=217090 RepID=UPI00040A5491|nr:hypothetical protein [Paenibacillus pasadenensis]